MSNAPLIILAGAGAILALKDDDDDDIGKTNTSVAAPPPGKSLTPIPIILGTSKGGITKTGGNTAGATNPLAAQSTGGTNGASLTLEQGKMQAEKYVKDKFNSLSEEAKAKGAAALNKQFHLNPPLTSKSSYKQVSQALGGAIGAAGCASLGVGVAVAPLCGIAGAYLGMKAGDLAKKAYLEVKDVAKEAWKDAKQGVKKGFTKAFGWLS